MGLTEALNTLYCGGESMNLQSTDEAKPNEGSQNTFEKEVNQYLKSLLSEDFIAQLGLNVDTKPLVSSNGSGFQRKGKVKRSMIKSGGLAQVSNSYLPPLESTKVK